MWSTFTRASTRTVFCGVLASLLTIGVGLRCGSSNSDAQGQDFADFASDLNALLEANHVPGLSAAIVKNGEIAWTAGFGFADLETGIKATPDTPYRLASLSKPFAALLLMQLVDEGRLDLDAPMKDFTIHPWFEPDAWPGAHYPSRYESGEITVRHVLTHTSRSEPPGSSFQYDGNVFADLTWVAESITGTSYPELLRNRIIDRVDLNRTLPAHLVPWGTEVVSNLPVPYAVNGSDVSPGSYPAFGLEPGADLQGYNLDPAYQLSKQGHEDRLDYLGDHYTPLYGANAAAGVISTVVDLATLDLAIDNHSLISEEQRKQMFSPPTSHDGQKLPYGLGWFVEDYNEDTFVWHYGWFPPTVSALFLKVPSRDVTLILLSNSDRLSADFSWTEDGVQASPYARLFIRHFVTNE